MSRESIYAEWERPGWTQTGLNEYRFTREGQAPVYVHATHKRAYINGVKYQSLMEAIKAAEVANDPR